ncbi:chemotaxis protein CheW [Erythrobacter sp. SCSIO 43205]|uniref:chemotaxis protein CheW n=1 Tax=Erythrobacter sp. SCSIO 43205 TaxID=2779361 RepID=UPI001CA8BC2A|nr:chemotaxis protein CheW [Erythrobacter sp. SCSIO 43205]UAB77860.1 chemotaxis protein CheW [Erythrobacter sp. SCSIO 43205]
MNQTSIALVEPAVANRSNWDADDQLEVLTFNIGEECLAVEAVMIREILDLLPETRVPGAPSLVPSVINFRGKIIPLADLRIAFGMPLDPPTVDSRIVVIEIESAGEATHVGLRTDKVHEVTTLSRSNSSEPPVLGLRWPRHYVREFVRTNEGVVVLPDLNAIFESVKRASGAIRAKGGLN